MVVGVVAQRGNERAQQLAADIEAAIADIGEETRFDETTGEALGVGGVPVPSLAECPLVVSIGGDGTFLFTARSVGSTPILGVNLGEVGFLNGTQPDDAVDVIPEIYASLVDGTADLQRLPRIEATHAERTIGPALNEILVHSVQRGPAGRFEVIVFVDGHEYMRDAVDGVLIATPTGSTAYNLSERGPLVTPDVEGLIVNAMCGRDPMPPLVVPLDAMIEVRTARGEDGWVISDGRTRSSLSVPGTVQITQAPQPVQIAGPPVDFFNALGKLK